jgi:hypothetical protein
MTPSYALALENVTTDAGPISSHGQRKIDARHYNGFLLTPGIVYHMTLKIQNSLLNNRYGNPFEVVSSISSLDLEIICKKLRISKFMEHISSTLT